MFPKMFADLKLRFKYYGMRTPVSACGVLTQAGSSASSDRAILVHKRQQGNPMLRCIKNVPIRYTDEILADFVLGSGAAALYLSLRYHLLHPGHVSETCPPSRRRVESTERFCVCVDYLAGRVGEMKRHFDLRIILCLVDIEDSEKVVMCRNVIVDHRYLIHCYSTWFLPFFSANPLCVLNILGTYVKKERW